MLGHREMQLDDYLVMLRRRKWWILVPALIAPLLAYGFSLTLHNRYTSQTLVMVEGQKVPENYVRSVVTEELNQRLGYMQEQIQSRTSLQPLIERFGLYKEDVGKVPMEDLVDRMRKQIEVRVVRSDESRGPALAGFYISFTSDNPRTAQQLAQEITSMFITENLKQREQQAQGTTSFLTSQLEDSKRRLDELDRKLAEFKSKYIGQLPGNEQNNFSMLTGLASRLDATTAALSRATQDKAFIESMLAQQLAGWEASQTAGPNTSALSETNVERMESQLSVMQNQLLSMETRYTNDYPDLVKMRADVAQLKKRIEDAREARNKPPERVSSKPHGNEPKEIQQLRYQRGVIDQTVKEKTIEQEHLKRDIGMYQSRIQLSPKVEEEYKLLSRDYQTAWAFYNDLLAKQTQSQMATNLEHRQGGEQFKIMDAANLPERPSFPDRPKIAGSGFGLGLVLGLGLALLLELRDKSIRNERDVEFYLGLPALAMLPRIGNTPDAESGPGAVKRGKLRWLMFWKRNKRAASPRFEPAKAEVR
jgi:polysaccharide chain length determinant protein (PEP-CTERM system associated)